MHNKKEISEANTFVVQCDLGLNANDFLRLPRRGKMKVSTNEFFSSSDKCHAIDCPHFVTEEFREETIFGSIKFYIIKHTPAIQFLTPIRARGHSHLDTLCQHH